MERWSSFWCIPNSKTTAYKNREITCHGGNLAIVQLRFGKLDSLSFRDKIKVKMPPFPIKTCVVCGEEFELKPGKPGFANRCPSCSEEDAAAEGKSADPLKSDKGANAARREAMRNLLYRKDS
jgi:hypothetical protein